MTALEDAQQAARAWRDALLLRKWARRDRFLHGTYYVAYTFVTKTDEK